MYKWKPSQSQRKAFAIRMQDAGERTAYEARKQAKADKRRAGSKFDYSTAGGEYVPTQYQYVQAIRFLANNQLTPEQFDACTMVINAYTSNERVHHDYIHIVNELIRATNNL